jgi:geranylgeranyl diphosphate synthase, type I
LEDYIRTLLPAVEAELHLVLAKVDNHTPHPEIYRPLRGMLAYHLGWEGPGSGPEAQGKRVRPLLLLLCAAAAGGDWKAALPAAAAVELLHNFSLIHDDIQDQSRLRRGRETVWVQWGVPQAINAGDLMFSLAQLAMLRLDAYHSPQVTLRAARIFQDTCIALTRGQYLDMSYETRQDLDLDDYWPMITGKTAALLAACAQLGGLIGDADPQSISAFRQYGEALGLAFQVQDDWLGIWGDSAVTGKSVDSDLVTGKKTLPVLYGLGQNGAFAARWRSGPITPAETGAIAALLIQEGAQEFTQAAADRLTRQATDALQTAVPASNPACQALTALTQKLLQRSG